MGSEKADTGWAPMEYRRLLSSGARCHVWREWDSLDWCARVIDATNTLQHEAMFAFATAEAAMRWADSRSEP